MRATPSLAAGLLLAGLLAASLAAPTASAGPAERAAAVAAALRTRRISSASMEKATVDDLVRFLRIATGFNFHVRRDLIQKAGIDLEGVSFTFALEDVTVAGLLRLLLPPHGLGAVVRDNVVHVTTRADAQGRPVTRLYDVTHLAWRLTDFAGPSLDLRPGGLAVEEVAPEVVRDDPLADPQNVLELVKTLVDADWSTEGWSIAVNARFLVVRAPPSVQGQVARALEQVAAFK